MISQKLLLFSIGPVQDFIAGARSTRDLWTGSYILSHLAEKACQKCQNEGAKLIFPARTSGSQSSSTPIATFPNKFSISVENINVETIAQIAEEEARVTWRNIASEVDNVFDGRTNEKNWNEKWQTQIDNLLEIYWVAVDFEQGQEQEALSRANLLLDARKQLRNFNPYIGDQREKDTTDGLFEQMGPVDAETNEVQRRRQVGNFWNELRANLQKNKSVARLAPNERLSAINLTKRFAWECYFEKFIGKKLPRLSTADVATAYWKEQVRVLTEKDAEVQQALEKYLDSLRNYLINMGELESTRNISEVDGRYFYPEMLDNTVDNELVWREVAVELIEQAKTDLKRFLRLITERDPTIGPPPRYYSILFLDGDKMGEVLSGKRTKPSLSPRSVAEISGDLINYAGKIAEIVQTHYGDLIYTGGDDALILLPNFTVFKCAVELKKHFPLTETTVSMGVAIAHYKYSLQQALKAGRQAEHKAKNKTGRNALYVEVIKRSGETVAAGSHWSEANETIEVFATLDKLKECFKREWVSVKLPYRLRQEMQMLLGGKDDGNMTKLLQSELARLFRRQSNTELAQKEIALVENELKQLANQQEALQKRLSELKSLKVDFDNLPDTLNQLTTNIPSFEEFCNLMLVAAFLARGSDDE